MQVPGPIPDSGSRARIPKYAGKCPDRGGGRYEKLYMIGDTVSPGWVQEGCHPPGKARGGTNLHQPMSLVDSGEHMCQDRWLAVTSRMSPRSGVSECLPGLAGTPTVYTNGVHGRHTRSVWDPAYRAGKPTRYKGGIPSRYTCVYRLVCSDRTLLARPRRGSTTLRHGSPPPRGAADVMQQPNPDPMGLPWPQSCHWDLGTMPKSRLGNRSGMRIIPELCRQF